MLRAAPPRAVPDIESPEFTGETITDLRMKTPSTGTVLRITA
jgi:hypothetical protein